MMKNNDLELRFDSSFAIKEEKAPDGDYIYGRAITFNSESKDLGFVEVIKPEACTRQFIDSQDVFLLFNHEDDKVLGRRSKGVGNLEIEVKTDGVYYRCKVLNNTTARDAMSYISSGLMRGSSFGFKVDPEKDNWYRSADGKIHREIGGFKNIFEFSTVYNPAYEASNCQCRAYDEFLKNEAKAEIEQYRQRLDAK